LIRHLVLIQ
jgi:hypothetical protein